MPELPAQPEDSRTVQAIYAAYEAKQAAQQSRGYLGASVIGKPCERSLWYGFRLCTNERFSGQMLALFRTGDWAENQFTEELRSIGCEVHDVDPATGEQFEIRDLAGHFSGHMDGCALGVPEAPKTWHVCEYKTHNDKSFASLREHGVKASKPEHYAQMQIYMHATGMTRALYLAKNKNDDARYSERVHYNADHAKALMARAERIIKASVPPAKISDDRDHFICRWCPHQNLCHGPEDTSSPAVPCKVNCRNCVHATPEFDSDHGRWSCAKHRTTIDRNKQDRACPDHLFIPSLITFAEVEDAGYSPDGDWTEYRNPDGATWRNKKSEHGYTSIELTQLPASMVGAGAVDAVKQEFDCTLLDVKDSDPFDDLKIIAWDDDGNKFTKTVKLDFMDSGLIIDLGWPVRYYVKDVLPAIDDRSGPVCIDGAGLNHKGAPVYIDRDEFKKILLIAADREGKE